MMTILKKGIYYLFGLAMVVLTACGREVSTTAVTVTCPANLSIELLAKTVPSNSITLPLPIVVTDCGNGDFSYTTNLPDQIQEGIYNVEYYISNPCGNKDTC